VRAVGKARDRHGTNFFALGVVANDGLLLYKENMAWELNLAIILGSHAVSSRL
jgi:hypothetical protein